MVQTFEYRTMLLMLQEAGEEKQLILKLKANNFYKSYIYH